LALRTFQLARARDSQQRTILVLVTDGRANVTDPDAAHGSALNPLEDAIVGAHDLRLAGVPALVIDTEEGSVRMGLARTLVQALDATYVELATLEAAPVANAVRSALSRTQSGLKRAKNIPIDPHSNKRNDGGF